MKRGWEAHKTTNLADARSYVRQYAPYLSPTLYGLIPTPMEGLRELAGGPLAVTDRLVLYYEPEWVAEMGTIVLATGLAHECLHDQLRHVARSKLYPNKKRWNQAGDLFINGSMRTQMKPVNRNGAQKNEPMWEFPDWALMPERYNFPIGLTADAYYALLEKLPGKKGDGGSGETGEGEGSTILCGTCGGVAGNPLSQELESRLNQEKGRSEAECKAIAKNTAQQLQKHMEGTSRGNLPGSWAELIQMSDEVFVVPWRAKLSNIARYSIGAARVGGLDYSMRRPSKRSALRGIPLPGLIAYDPDIIFIVDSSRSMGHQQLADALRVVSDVMLQTGIRNAWFMEADVGKQRDPIRVNASDLRNMEIRGRGGTDFRPAIEFVDKKFKPRPNITFYITDGDGNGVAPPEPPPNMHFVWCVVPSGWSRRPANWGDYVSLSDVVQKEEETED